MYCHCGFCGSTFSCFACIIVSMLRNPVSSCIISLGVVVGIFRILLMILSNIVLLHFWLLSMFL